MASWPKTVLLVDDENTVRLVTAKMLEVDRAVLSASSGQEAIEIFEQRGEEIDCVLLDVVMPNLNGVQTFHALREIRPDVPVLFMSGYCKEDAVKDLVQGYRCGFIKKPYRRKTLIAQLEELAMDTEDLSSG